MKKLLVLLVICIMSLGAYAQDGSFHPYCSGNDGVSYVQGRTEKRGNVTPTIYLEGYGKYKNATVLVILYVKDNNGNEKESYRETVTIRDGEGKKILSSLTYVTRIEIRVADYCN